MRTSATGQVDLARELLRRGPVSGLADCHSPGIYSIVLHPRRDVWDGMLRIFYAGPEARLDVLEDREDFVVMMHNHRQDLDLQLLFGRARNVCLVERPDGPESLHEYAFESAILTGGFNLTYRRAVSGGFRFDEITPEGIHLNWSDVHTVVAPAESAWLVKEWALAPELYISLSYSRRPDKKLDPAGLYREMLPGELMGVADRIIRGMK